MSRTPPVPADAEHAGDFAFQASYSGDGTYTGSTGPCEPLFVFHVASSTVTVIHDAAHGDGDVGAGGDGGARPGHGDRCAGDADGDGEVRWFTNGTCEGEPIVTSSPFTLAAGGVVDATEFPQTPTTGGMFAFQAAYSGDDTYDGLDRRV